jgi:type VI secretion system protein
LIGVLAGRSLKAMAGLAAAGLFLSLASCGSSEPEDPRLGSVNTQVIEIQVARNINDDYPVAVDAVLVYNSVLYDELLKTSAKDWFAKVEQYRLDYPRGFDVWRWEVVPGQAVPSQLLPDTVNQAIGMIVFANYFTPGEHRAAVGATRGLRIYLLDKTFALEPFLPPE